MTAQVASGRFISTQSVVLAVNLQVVKLPERGTSVLASSANSVVGGGFTTLSVAAAQGVPANLAAPLGTGPNSFAVRKLLSAENITPMTGTFVGDIGVSIVMIEADGTTATVRTAGVETEPTAAALDSIELFPGDLVHINGAELATPAADVITHWGSNLPEGVRLVVATSPAVDEIPPTVWLPLLGRADIVTANIREAAALTGIVESSFPGRSLRDLMRPDAALVRRLGESGCDVQVGADADSVHVPPFPAHRVDTTGVGDTHVAAMCAGLLQGRDLVQSCLRANAAAALMIAREFSWPVPSPADIDQVLETGVVGAP